MRASVVVASCRSRGMVEATIDSLRQQCARHGAELIVARGSPREMDEPEQPFADCVLIPCPEAASIPELRGAGLAAASGDWVALTEDNCVARPDWLDRLAEGFAPGVDVVGGTMGNAHPDRAVDAAAFFAEYGFFGTARRALGGGASPFVSGANVAYGRSVLGEAATLAAQGEWEGVIHHRLASSGATFALASAATVEQNVHHSFQAFCLDRFRHGRAYGRIRGQAWGVGKRGIGAGASVLLPLLMTARAWRFSGSDQPMVFLRAMPYTLAFCAAWAAGEAAGYLNTGQS